MGSLITFEGIDGSGKSTQIRMLENLFNSFEISYKTFREPGSTILSEKIRTILLDKKNIDLHSISESLLFAAARAQLVNEKIKPELERNRFVICDRFIDSTIAYQGYGRGLDIKKLEKINYIATDGLIPDITLILDIKPEIATKRINQTFSDRMEKMSCDIFNNIRNGYLQIENSNDQRCKIINGEKSPAYIFEEIKKQLIGKFGELFK